MRKFTVIGYSFLCLSVLSCGEDTSAEKQATAKAVKTEMTKPVAVKASMSGTEKAAVSEEKTALAKAAVNGELPHLKPIYSDKKSADQQTSENNKEVTAFKVDVSKMQAPQVLSAAKTTADGNTKKVNISSPKPEAKAVAKNVEETKKTDQAINLDKVIQEQPQVVKATSAAPKKVEKAAAAVSHKVFDALLRKYVSATGKVNYKGIKSEQDKLDGYLNTLAKNPVENSWSRKEKMAYWINLYNAATLKLITDNYPISSITKLSGGKPWDVKNVKSGSKMYSLNNIENDILRPQFKDARIHFAVNCAAKSCPPLLNKAWTAGNLEQNFETQAKKFINNSSFNSISSNKVEISKIFEWYAVDFGNIVTYLNKYSKQKINAGASVSYKEYNWQLNE